MAPVIAFKTWGCKLNQAETQDLKEKLFSRFPELILGSIKKPADLYVLNSCAVTQKAEKEVRQTIHSLQRISPQALILVAGCFTSDLRQREKEKVYAWLPNQEKKEWDQFILNILSSCAVTSSRQPEQKNLKKKTRFFLGIQSGCQQYCSYCIVPYLRPDLKNKPIPEVVAEVKKRQKQGFQEVVLTGTNIGNYQDRSSGLIDLLQAILEKTDLPRLRLSSLWPTVISSKLIGLFRVSPRLCPHFHLSIQSASDRILKLMGRSYQRKDLERVVQKIISIPQVNLTADLIVGFPGETEVDFKETYEFIKNHNFLKTHIFRFSPRPGTKAFSLKGSVSSVVKKQRAQKLLALSRKQAMKIKKSYQGETLPILIEGKKQDFWQGFSHNYLRVFLKSQSDLANKIVIVKIKDLKKGFLEGEFLKIEQR
ncbi:tRNA (N(6)-L-threonylcarbamoyladenosine(37)-C(2))-methylthiotransferase MtaB [Patescibacteria group bacterium]|nr:tRNA (N(6)-L-threonylcarbamoyladenosine(37)-C(2))-methylthiotransferase MtaB [Patescibacteria group bacterium]